MSQVNSSLGACVERAMPSVVHPTAIVGGTVSLAPGVSIWPYAVIRAEVEHVAVGARTNIQDFVMIHVGLGAPTTIGRDCSITHRATLHGCTIGDACMIGIGATIMDGAVIGAGSRIAGHAIVTEGQSFPQNAIIAGVPAKQIGTRDQTQANRVNAITYWHLAQARVQGRDVPNNDDQLECPF